MSRKLEIAVAGAIQVIGKFAMLHRWSKVEGNVAKLIDEWNNEMIHSAIALGTADMKILGNLIEYNAKVQEIAETYNKWVSETGGIELIAIGELSNYVEYITGVIKSPHKHPNKKEFQLTDVLFSYKSPSNTYVVVNYLISNMIAKSHTPTLYHYFPSTAASTATIRRAPVRIVASTAPVNTSNTVASTSTVKRSRVEPL